MLMLIYWRQYCKGTPRGKWNRADLALNAFLFSFLCDYDLISGTLYFHLYLFFAFVYVFSSICICIFRWHKADICSFKCILVAFCATLIWFQPLISFAFVCVTAFVFVFLFVYVFFRDDICHKQRLCKIIITRVKVHFLDVF